MAESWKFDAQGCKVKVTNSWLFGIKLFIDGKLRDKDSSFFDSGEEGSLSAKLDNSVTLEVVPKPGLVGVQMDAYLIGEQGRQLIFSSYQPLS